MGWRHIPGLVALSFGAAALAVSEASSKLIVGAWSSGARPEWDLTLEVTPTEVTYGACTSSYAIVREERSTGRWSKMSDDGTWTYIAIQLRVDRSTSVCRNQSEVLEFGIPDEMTCHADLATYRTMEDFRKSAYSQLSVSWGNVDCIHGQAPNKSLERTRER
jgi:hypothetical protein